MSDHEPATESSAPPNGPATRAACPWCHRTADRVNLQTVKSLLLDELRASVTRKRYHFCAQPDCELVYFSPDGGPAFSKQQVSVRVGIKETEDPIPVCYCFGHTRGSIRDELDEHGQTRVVESIRQEIAAGRCSCETMNPSGKCCLGSVVETVAELKGDRVDSEETSPAAAGEPPSCDC